MREIKFRGKDMNGSEVFGLLTKKRIRATGKLAWAIATGSFNKGETIPVSEGSIEQFICCDKDGFEVYEGDLIRYICEWSDEEEALVPMRPFPCKATFRDYGAILDGEAIKIGRRDEGLGASRD